MTNVNPNTFTTRPEIEGTFGVVTSTHWIATAVGMGDLGDGRQCLRCRGGDRFHAAGGRAASQRARAAMCRSFSMTCKRGKPEVICGQGVAPAGATIAHYRSEGLDLVPGTGLLAACVPGTFETWMMLLRDYGTMRWPTCWRRRSATRRTAIRCSSAPTPRSAPSRSCSAHYWPTSAAVYLPNNKVPATGSLFANKTLAATYSRIVKEAESAGGDRVAQIERARKSWSHGFVAEAIDRFCRTQDIMDTSGRKHRGVLTADDMARWTPHVEAPLTYDYRGYTVCKTGPWGQGPVTLQQLALLKGFDLDGLDPTGPDFIHLIVECSKLAYADREVFYGDPDFVEVPMATLLSDAYNTERRKLDQRQGLARTAPRLDRGLRRGGEAAPRDRCRMAAGAGEPTVGRLGAGEPTVGRHGRHARRHRAFRHRRSGRQHGVVDAVGRLAAFLAGHSRTRLLPRHPRADVLARGRPSGGAWRPASGRAPRCRRPWRCATASRISPGARPAATARISGSRSSSCATSIAA